MAHHDPTVTAAVIAVVGTSVIAIGGYITTMVSTGRALKSAAKTANEALASSESNVRETIVGEREHRLWERRTESYLDVLAFTTHRQTVREHQARKLQGNESKGAIEATLDSYAPRGSWFDLFAQLHAYATGRVNEAFAESHKTNEAFLAAATAVKHAPPGGTTSALRACDEAVKAADAADAALIHLIRDEIQRVR